jgi:hypothetical protein
MKRSRSAPVSALACVITGAMAGSPGTSVPPLSSIPCLKLTAQRMTTCISCATGS